MWNEIIPKFIFRWCISWPGLSYSPPCLDVVIFLVSVYYYNQIYCPLFGPLRLNIDQMFVNIFQFQNMIGLVIACIGVSALLLLYLVLQLIGCVRSKNTCTQRGIEGLPGLDSPLSPSTSWPVLGNFLYLFYRFSCRLCPS